MVKPEYIVALDYGEKRIGVAIAHEVAKLPRPLTTLTNGPDVLHDIQKLLNQEAACLVVVGLPRGMDGGYTAQTRAAEAFMKQLASSLPLPVVVADETLTSVDAAASLGQGHTKADVDAMAATYILERYLSEQAAREHTV